MPFRPLPLCVAASMVLGSLGSAGAQQPAPPPGRVGRIAAVTGPVSFHVAGAAEWQLARINLPVSDGTGLWVAPAGEAAIGVGGGNRLVLGPGTEFDLDRLDDGALAATQAQGESYLRLRLVAPGETYTVQTPRGTVTIASAGRYEIVSGDTEHATAITVLDGAATVTGLPTAAEVGPGLTLTIAGDGAATPFAPNLGPTVQDAFLRHVLAEERPPAARQPAAPAIVAQMTGAEALQDVGEWAETPEYGPIWYPPVPNYIPYRQGRWGYVAPWGWTWVDDAPWGFAPTHYGRWTQIGGRWGWVPGRDWGPERRPVYAPALVGFLGGAALGVGRGPVVGWAPLGPRDPYRPPYQVDDRVLQRLNQPTGARSGSTVVLNREAITIVPEQVLTGSAPVTGAIRPGPLPPAIGLARRYSPEARPTRATIGATQAVLHQVSPTGLAAPATHVGPGPSLAGAAPGLRRPLPRNATLPELRPREAMPPALGASVPASARPLPPSVASPRALSREQFAPHQAALTRPQRVVLPRPEPLAGPHAPTRPAPPPVQHAPAALQHGPNPRF